MKVVIGYTGSKRHQEVLAQDVEIVQVTPSWGVTGPSITDLGMSINEEHCPYFIYNHTSPCEDVVSSPFDYECIGHGHDGSFQCPHLMKLSCLGGKYLVSCSGGKKEK
jgi:hypothetical protein